METLIGALDKDLACEVALFSHVLRVTGCGLFFAGVIASSVLRSKNLGNCVARNSLNTSRIHNELDK